MSAGYVLYNTLISLAAPFALGAVALKGRLRGNWKERLGFVDGVAGRGSPRIWVHAVSVGEMQVAASLVGALKELQPDAVIWQTTTTDTGREAAEKLLDGICEVRTFPLDAYGGPARAIDRLKPDLIILLETELWPNFIRTAHERGVRLMLANGRISVRSVGRYQKAKFLFDEVLNYLDLMAMIRPEDQERIISLGADPEKVNVSGSAKFDRILQRADPAAVERFRRELGLEPGRPVLVAGSTRTGEEEILLNSFKTLRSAFPSLHLILAPRHVMRADEIESRIKRLGLTCRRRSAGPERVDIDPPDVTLIDVMGELFYLYGLSTVSFCGGSLFDQGGQNPLEASVWSRPVLFGPSMDDFLDARDMLLENGGAMEVKDGDSLTGQLRCLLENPEAADRMGRAGRKALENHKGVSARLASMALNLLWTNGRKIAI